MHLTTNLKAIIAMAVMAFFTIDIHSQDLMAMQAPVDRAMRAVDTMALRSIIARENAMEPSSELYTQWTNKKAHPLEELPDSFRIDLRGFSMPTPSRVITSNFGKRWGRMHKGLDIKVYIGDTIYAAFDGKVRMVSYEARGYGNFVVIRHGNGLETIYGHMSRSLVSEDELVRAGDPIGLGGNTGRSTGSHLHFETRICGVALNPALMFDFVNQDVTGDFYMFRANSYERESRLAAKNIHIQDKYTEEEVRGKVTGAPTLSYGGQSKSKSKSGARYHKVRKGETLSSISRKYGVSLSKLCKLNRISTKTKIRVGQRLRYS